MRSAADRLTSSTSAPALRAHARERLVAGDARVVHDDVDAAVLALEVRDDRLRRVRRR